MWNVSIFSSVHHITCSHDDDDDDEVICVYSIFFGYSLLPLSFLFVFSAFVLQR